MRKINVIEGQPLNQDTKASTQFTDDGRPKSKSTEKNTTSAFSKQSPKPSRQGPKLRVVSTASSHVNSELTFQVERFADIAPELPPLFARHWDELGERDVPLDPDWQRMLVAEAQGQLKVVTARCGKILVGYIFNLLGRHPHSKSSLYSNIDNFWLDPAYRGSFAVMRWLKLNDAMLDELHVKKRYIGVPNNFMSGRVGNLFRRLGYRPVETTWSR